MATKNKPAASAPVNQRKDSKYKIVRNVTMPALQLKLEEECFIKVTAPYFTGKAQTPKAGEEAKKPAIVLPVIEVETGEVFQLILGTALQGILDDNYPKDSYVGKAFRVVKHDKKAGKRYFSYSLDEIDA